MVDALQAKLEKYEGQGDLKTSYEQLFVAQDLLNSGDVENAFTTLSQVNRDLLGEGGQAIYDEIAPDINSRMYAIYYADAKNATKDENYEEAIAKYQAILEAEETYDDGQALYNLAEVYLLSGDTETAKTTYARVVELFEDKRIAKKAQAKIEALDAGDEVKADNVSTRTTTTEETTETSTEETPQE
jgi:tetratricopeptide (TPR) repeat protein